MLLESLWIRVKGCKIFEVSQVKVHFARILKPELSDHCIGASLGIVAFQIHSVHILAATIAKAQRFAFRSENNIFCTVMRNRCLALVAQFQSEATSRASLTS